MSHVSIVFLVELGERGVELGRLLTRAGFDTRAISAIEIGNALDHILPAVIVCPHVCADGVAKALRGRPGSTEITWFAMAPESAGPHVKGSLPREVTAVVRDDIDPGILSLRLKAATQQAPGPRAMAQTLMGVIAPADGPALQGPGSVPPASWSQPPASHPSSAGAPASVRSAAQVAAGPQSIPPAPQSIPPAPQSIPPVVAGAQSIPAPPQSVAPGPSQPAQGLSNQLPSLVPTIPPAPLSQPSGAVVAPGAASIAPLAGGRPSAPSSTASVVMPDVAAQDPQVGSSPSSKKKFVLAAAAVVVIGGGGAFWMSAPEQVSVQAASVAQPAPSPSAVASAANAAVAPSAPAAQPATPDPAPSAPAPDSSATHELYKVSNVTTIDDCDKVLEKPLSYYEKQPKWKAAAYWKTARRFLLQGKDDLAFAQMCQAVSVDPASQALGGLVNYFLRHRALAQAQTWAERGIAASKNNRIAKDALGDTLSQLGKVDEARALWLETAKLTEDKKAKMQAVARNWLKLAKKSQKGGDWALSERLLRRAAAFDADNADVASALAATLQKNEQSALAKNWATRALELDPQSKDAAALLATLK